MTAATIDARNPGRKRPRGSQSFSLNVNEGGAAVNRKK